MPGVLFPWVVITAGALAIFVGALVPHERLERLLWPLPPATDGGWWLAGGLALVTVVLALLEWRGGWFFFTQEDAHSIFLPVVFYASEGLFEKGVFSTWNGYQSLGSPTASLGLYALTYPFTYVAYGFARFVLGNHFLTFEVFAWGHILAGFAVSWLLLRRMGVGGALGVAAAMACVFMGYYVTAGRGWFYMLPTLVYLPLLAYLLLVFDERKPTWGWIIASALTLGFFYHANVKPWFYGTLFWGLGCLWLMKGRWKTHFWALALAWMMLMVLPLLVVQAIDTATILRGAVDISAFLGTDNMFLPWPLAQSPNPLGEQHRPGGIYFLGGVFFVLFVLRACMALPLAAWPSRTIKSYLICFAVMSLWLSLGDGAKLWTWISQAYPFSRFRAPIRWLPFAGFAIILAGAVFARRWARTRWRDVALATIAIVAVFWNVFESQDIFSRRLERPYPLLAPEATILPAMGWTRASRVFPLPAPGLEWPIGAGTFTLSYATQYRIPAVLGHYGWEMESTLLENRHAMEFFLRSPDAFCDAFGIAWVLVSKMWPRPIPDAEFVRLKNARPVQDMGSTVAVSIQRDTTRPMAWAGDSFVALPYRIHPDGVEVDVSEVKAPSRVTANFLFRHWFTATTDAGAVLEVRPGFEHQLQVQLPHNARTVYFRYCPPWHWGLGLGVTLLIGGVFCRLFVAQALMQGKRKLSKSKQVVFDEAE